MFGVIAALVAFGVAVGTPLMKLNSSISASKEMFLNKKNIINVSISRARDYLFIIMPDDDTENVDNLRLVKRVERLAREERATEWHSHDLGQHRTEKGCGKLYDMVK